MVRRSGEEGGCDSFNWGPLAGAQGRVSVMPSQGGERCKHDKDFSLWIDKWKRSE